MVPRFLWWLLALTLVRQLVYIAVTPPFQGPDEPGHFEYVALIYRLGRIPAPLPDTESDPELTRAINAAAASQRFELFHTGISLRRLSEQEPPVLAGPREAGYQHPAYYLLLLPVYALFSGQDVLTQYYALSVASSLLAVVTVLAAGLLARRLFPDDDFAQAALPLWTAFWPTQTYMMSRLNNDNLATVIGAATALLVAVVLERGLTWRTASVLAGLAFLAAVAKGTTLFLLPIIGLAVALRLSRRISAERRRRLFGLAAVAAGLGVAALAGVWLVPTLAAAVADLMRLAPWASLRAWQWLTDTLAVMATGRHWDPERLAVNRQELAFVVSGFWALFGWGRLRLEAGWYWAAALTAGLAGVGLLWRAVWGRWRAAPPWRVEALGLFALAFALAWVPLIARMIINPYAAWWHGRSLLPALLPAATFLALGLSGVVPKRARALGLQVLLCALVLVDTAALAGTIVPYYYQ